MADQDAESLLKVDIRPRKEEPRIDTGEEKFERGIEQALRQSIHEGKLLREYSKQIILTNSNLKRICSKGSSDS